MLKQIDVNVFEELLMSLLGEEALPTYLPFS